MRILKILYDRNFTVRLKTQLIASFLAMTIVIVSVISILVYNSVLSILKKQSEEMVTRQFSQSEYNIVNFRDQLEKMAGLLAINKDVQSFIGPPDAQDEATRLITAQVVIKAMDSILVTYPYVHSIALYSRSGEALSDSVTGSWYSNDAKEAIPFYSSALYEKISKKSFGFLWEGKTDSSLFGLTERAYPNEKPIPYMTVVRNVNVLGSVNFSAVLVVNVRQSEFSSIYNGTNGNGNNSAPYLIDADGIIISHSDPSLIGSKVPLADRIDHSQQNGSFTLQSDGHSKQVTYYQIGKTGWTLVNETPETEFIRNILTLRQLIGIVILLSILLALLLSIYWIYRITKPFNHLVNAMREMEKGNFGIMLDETPSTELGIIGRRFNKMSMSIEELMEKNKSIEEEKRYLELESLQSQINPHFLYNALNTIKWVAMVRKELSIVDGITTLGNMLRSIYKDRSLMMTLQEEIDYIENYLKIMNARYGEGVQVSIHVPKELRTLKLIRFILQPIVENAFLHGMNSKSFNGKIEIAASRSKDDLFISVSDNGTGIPEDRLDAIRKELASGDFSPSVSANGSIGLSNVNRRIKMQYGKSYGLTVDSHPDKGTEVTIRVPVIS
jgi:two-component system, sensor histidine kinase YesM